MNYWILDENKNAVQAPMRTWAAFFENFDNRKIKQEYVGSVHISTVFLGLDHQYGDGPPLLFETMIFGGEHDRYQTRCSTWQEAEAMHDKAVALVRGDDAAP